MKSLVVPIFAIVVLCAAAPCGAQVGLYGAPEMLQIQAGQAPPVGQYHTSAPSEGTSHQGIVPLPAPTPASYQASSSQAPASRWVRPTTGMVPYQATMPSLSPPHLAKATPVPAAPAPQPVPPKSKPAVKKPKPPAKVQPHNLTNQLLQEACGACDVDSAYGDGLSGCGIGEPPTCDTCTVPACCPWYAATSVLAMSRDQPNRLWTTYWTNHYSDQLMSTTDIGLAWRVGGEVTIGRRFCCGLWSLEATYWGLDSFSGTSSMSLAAPESVSTPMDVQRIEFATVNGQNYFDGAAEHRLWRRNEIHNVEVNLIRHSLDSFCSPTPTWDAQWSAGVRYFRFEESLTFGSLRSGGTWGGSGGVNEAYIDEQITNSLIGAQVGCELGYQWLPGLRLYIAPQIGLYNNHMRQYFTIYRGDGVTANPTAASQMNDSYPVRSTNDALSFLTQIDVGMDWKFWNNWSARLGYRAVVATGIGLADNQIPQYYLVDIPEIRNIDHNGQLVLHGAYLGVTYNY